MSRRSLYLAMRQVDRDGQEFCVFAQDCLAAHVGGPTKTVVGGGWFRRCVEERGGQKCWNKVLRDLICPRWKAAGDTRGDGSSHFHESTTFRGGGGCGSTTPGLI